MLKKSNGVTMVQLVITIVMLVLIAAFSIYNSTDTISETKIAKAYEEITELKKAVMRYAVLNEEMTDLESFKLNSLSSYSTLSSYFADSSKQRLYDLDFKSNSLLLNEVLEVRNIENHYVVNVYNLNDVEIALVEGIKIKDKEYYTDKQILEAYNEIFLGR